MWAVRPIRIILELVGATLVWLIVWLGLYMLVIFGIRQQGHTGPYAPDLVFILAVVAFICAIDTVSRIERRRARAIAPAGRRIERSGFYIMTDDHLASCLAETQPNILAIWSVRPIRILLELVGATLAWLIVWIGLYILLEVVNRQQGRTSGAAPDLLVTLLVLAFICAVDTVSRIERRRTRTTDPVCRRVARSGWE
jgi:hypothetical protein